MFAIDISCDGQHVDTVAGETETEASNAAFAAVLRSQGQSVDYALKHGGWSMSAPYAARHSHVYGSSYFISRRAAVKYYEPYEGDTDDATRAVDRKLASGEIHIGKPTIKPGESCQADSREGRYYVAVFTRDG